MDIFPKETWAMLSVPMLFSKLMGARRAMSPGLPPNEEPVIAAPSSPFVLLPQQTKFFGKNKAQECVLPLAMSKGLAIASMVGAK